MLAGLRFLWMPRKGSVSCLSQLWEDTHLAWLAAPLSLHRQSHEHCLFQIIFHNLLSFCPRVGSLLQSENSCDCFGLAWITQYNIPHLNICDSLPSRKHRFLDRGAYSQVLGMRSWTSALSSTLGRRPGWNSDLLYRFIHDWSWSKAFTHHAFRWRESVRERHLWMTPVKCRI